jgi:DNA-binding transcriptional MerR regulator
MDAFRNIGEVSADLGVKKHVLRFWESKFPQLKPMKRGGGRRYYRPADVQLLCGIQHLLQNERYSIRGVQKILREQGPEEVKRLGNQAAAAAGKAEKGRVSALAAQGLTLSAAEVKVMRDIMTGLESVHTMLTAAAAPVEERRRTAARS